MWRTDGTSGGTELVKDIHPMGSGTSIPYMTCDGVIYFRADDGAYGHELWKTNGSTDGTVMVKDIQPGEHGSLDIASSTNRDFFIDDGLLFYS
ncbi:MAG: hypothetical protein R3C05_08695 [Pirellulaceae bacterium]